ncbi:hypothetical protein UFOVP238_45 [uncultured Caudovirales phage]|uniref:Uncharacterized protein n=1 Tax=uncultured Caudovirales phage TaxID=2100421 RepID=A0A6J7WZG1_9CAUD|nr:hypothetical protein UFOVP238_45 [uncultured Caudovirales phage]
MASKTLREQILGAEDTQSELVEVPQWGVTVEVRGMSGKSRAQFLANYTDEVGRVQWDRLYPNLLIHTVFDPETSEQVFLAEDSDAINLKSGSALEIVANVSLRLSGLNQEQQKEAGNVS